MPGFGIVKRLTTMIKLRFYASLILILIFSIVLNQLVLDTKFYLALGKVKRNYIELVASLITGLLGFIYFYAPKFIIFKRLWIFVYLASAFFLLVVTIVDNYIYSISTATGEYRFATLKEYLISPLLFIVFCVFEIISTKSQKSS